MCDSFKTLCAKCDNYIHSLPSKKLHKRQALAEEGVARNVDNKGTLLTSIEKVAKNMSMTVLPTTGGEWKVDVTVLPCNSNNNINTINDINRSEEFVNMKSPKSVYTAGSTFNTNNNVFNSQPLTSSLTGTYSKEYLNEIKVEFFK
jgi:hypothetical protein